jgi:hypothetical protein
VLISDPQVFEKEEMILNY